MGLGHHREASDDCEESIGQQRRSLALDDESVLCTKAVSALESVACATEDEFLAARSTDCAASTRRRAACCIDAGKRTVATATATLIAIVLGLGGSTEQAQSKYCSVVAQSSTCSYALHRISSAQGARHEQALQVLSQALLLASMTA